MAIWPRCRKDGTPVWYYRFFWRGQKYQGYIGPVSRRTAKQVELKTKILVAEGKYAAAQPPPPPPTFVAFAPRFLDWYAVDRRPQSWERYESRLRCHLLPYLGHLRLDACTTAVVDAYREARYRDGAKARTINGELTVLSQMLHTARDWEVLVTAKAPSIRLVRTEEAPQRILSEAEEARLLLAAPPRLRPLIVFGLHTGLRKQELTTLTWQHIDWERLQVEVTSGRAKNRKSRRIPLSQTARDILRDLIHPAIATIPSAPIFGYREWTMSFHRTRIRAGLREVTPHTLRRTFATRALERGVDIKTVQRWLGHSSITQTEKYLHPSMAHEQQAIHVLDRQTVSAIDPPRHGHA